MNEANRMNYRIANKKHDSEDAIDILGLLQEAIELGLDVSISSPEIGCQYLHEVRVRWVAWEIQDGRRHKVRMASNTVNETIYDALRETLFRYKAWERNQEDKRIKTSREVTE